MSSFLFVSGQIRALESKLLDFNRLERMIGAETPEDAFRVMVELEYARYIDDQTKAEDFARVVTQGILETKALIRTEMDNHKGFEFIFRRFDLNNIKRALKAKMVEGASQMPEFIDDNGFCPYGDIEASVLQAVIFDSKGYETSGIPTPYLDVILKANQIFEDHKGAFRFVEYALDLAHFAYLRTQVSGSFLQAMFDQIVTAYNVRLIGRSFLALGEEIPTEAFAPYGDISLVQARSVQSIKDLKDLIHRTRFYRGEDLIAEDKSATENLFALEQIIDQDWQRMMHDADLGQVGTIQVPMIYFERRLRDARWLKFIMFAKFNGLSPDEIHQTLKTI